MSPIRVRGTERVSGEAATTLKTEEAHLEQRPEVGRDSGLQRRKGAPSVLRYREPVRERGAERLWGGG